MGNGWLECRDVWSFYWSCSRKQVARELAQYGLDSVGVQQIRWDKGGTEPTELGLTATKFSQPQTVKESPQRPYVHDG